MATRSSSGADRPSRAERGIDTTADHGPEQFLARLSGPDRESLTALARRRHWPAGASLFLEGESSATVAVLVVGLVKVFSLTEHGKETVLAVLGPGALLGELSALDGAPRSASVAALEPVDALVLQAAAFVEFLADHPEAAAALLRLITARLRTSDRQRAEFAAYDIPARVARRLLELAERFGVPDEHGVRIAVPLSQDDLAGWVGASREAVVKALKTLRDRGFVTTGRRAMVVPDLDGLRKYCGG